MQSNVESFSSTSSVSPGATTINPLKPAAQEPNTELPAFLKGPTTPLPLFSEEIWLFIFSFFTLRQLLDLAVLSKRSALLVTDNSLWQNFLVPHLKIFPDQTMREVFMIYPERRRFNNLACDKKGKEFDRSLKQLKNTVSISLGEHRSIAWVERVPQYHLDPGFVVNFLEICQREMDSTDFTKFCTAIAQPDASPLFKNRNCFEKVVLEISEYGFKFIGKFIDTLTEPAMQTLRDNPVFLENLSPAIAREGISNITRFMVFLSAPEYQSLRNNPIFMTQLGLAIAKHDLSYLSLVINQLLQPDAQCLRNNPEFMLQLGNGLEKHGFYPANWFIQLLAQPIAKSLREDADFMRKMWRVIAQHGFYNAGEFIERLARTPSYSDNPIVMQKLWRVFSIHGFSHSKKFIGEFSLQLFENNPTFVEKMWSGLEKHGFSNMGDFFFYISHCNSKMEALRNNAAFMEHLGRAIELHGFSHASNFFRAFLGDGAESMYTNPGFIEHLGRAIETHGFENASQFIIIVSAIINLNVYSVSPCPGPATFIANIGLLIERLGFNHDSVLHLIDEMNKLRSYESMKHKSRTQVFNEAAKLVDDLLQSDVYKKANAAAADENLTPAIPTGSNDAHRVEPKINDGSSELKSDDSHRAEPRINDSSDELKKEALIIKTDLPLPGTSLGKNPAALFRREGMVSNATATANTNVSNNASSKAIVDTRASATFNLMAIANTSETATANLSPGAITRKLQPGAS